MKIKCNECGEEYPLSEVITDNVRFHIEDGRIVKLPETVTQEQINSVRLICECCQEDKNEKRR